MATTMSDADVPTGKNRNRQNNAETIDASRVLLRIRTKEHEYGNTA